MIDRDLYHLNSYSLTQSFFVLRYTVINDAHKLIVFVISFSIPLKKSLCIHFLIARKHRQKQAQNASSNLSHSAVEQNSIVWHKHPLIFDIGLMEWKLLTSINIFSKHAGKATGSRYFSRAVWDWGATTDDKCSFWPLGLICDFTAFRSAAMDTRYCFWPKINIIQFAAPSQSLILTSIVSVSCCIASDWHHLTRHSLMNRDIMIERKKADVFLPLSYARLIYITEALV